MFYFFFFFFSFFFSSTRCPLSLPLFYSPFLPHSPSFIRTFQELFLSPAPFLLFFFFFFTWFQNSLCDKKIFLSSLVQEHSRELSSSCYCSSSSPTQSRWVSWLLSFVFFFFFCLYCYDLINFKTVFLNLYSGNLIMLEFRDVWEKDCLLLWFVVFVMYCLFCVCSWAFLEFHH